MLNKNLFLWRTVFLMIYITYSVNGQYTCDDFYSPKILITDGTRLGTLVFPLTGSKYKPNQDCKWNIKTLTSGMVVKLKITSSYLQGRDIHGDCSSDYVDIFDVKNGEKIFNGRFCSSESGQIYESSGQIMIVAFTSNIAGEFSGFTASYQAVEERGNELDSHSTMLLAICIPVGVILIVLTIPFTWKMVKLYRQKSSSNSASSQRQVAQHGVNTVWDSDAQLDYYSYYQAHLQVIRPLEQAEDNPPSYDSLDYNHHPLDPPSYEDIIKESIPSSDSQV